jgi:glutamate-1-semialdehyde 2,1-aminomutase
MISFEKSKEMHEIAKKLIPLGTSSGMRANVEPIVYYERADGPWFYSVEGHKLLDYTLAWGPLILGSNNKLINQAVIEQLGKSYSLGAQHYLEIELAEKMIQVVPGLEEVIFSNTGTEAVQVALRLARAKTNRNKIIKFEGHYHGWMNNILVSYKPTKNNLSKATPTCGGQPESEFKDTIILPWNDVDALVKVFETHKNEIACVISEPILANSGSCNPKNGYLETIISLCKQNGAVSIFDEVITGFRIALGGAREYYHLNPDLSVYAKAMANGFTMSAVGGKREIFDVLRDKRTIHAGTYNGNSINLAAALSTLNQLSEPGIYQKMHQHGNAIRATIAEEGKIAGIKVITSGLGTVFSVHFGLEKQPENYEDTFNVDLDLQKEFRKYLLESAVQVLPDGRWYVSASHTENELAFVKDAIKNAFRKLRK